jgi:hypothetical protein
MLMFNLKKLQAPISIAGIKTPRPLAIIHEIMIAMKKELLNFY